MLLKHFSFDIVSLLWYNSQMELKERIDIIAKQAEIVYKKIFIFSAIAGGSWIYGIKTDDYLGFVIWFVFALSTMGVVINLTKQGTLYTELEEMKNGKY